MKNFKLVRGTPSSLAGARRALVSLSAALFGLMAMPGAAQNSLPETVVTASRTAQRIEDAQPDTSLITRADIERSQARDVPTLLSQLAGMEVTQSGGMGGVATLYMRGAESRHALVLVDGLPMNNLNFNLASLEHLPLSGVERIEVVRGNVSSLYGSSALGGVVQIFTRQNQKGPWLDSSAQAGPDGFRSAQVSAGKKWSSGLGISGSFESVKTNGFNALNAAQRPGINLDRDGYSRNSSSLNLTQDWEQSRLGFVVRETLSKTQYDSQYGPANQADESKSILRSAVFNGMVKLSSNLELDASVGQQQDKLNAAVTAYPYYVNSKSTTSAAGLAWKFSPNQSLTAGLEKTQQDIESDTAYNASGRSVDSWRMGYLAKIENHQFQLNARHDQYSDFGDANTWYAGYAYQLSSNWRLKASSSTGFMAPTFNDLYYPYGGNAKLRAEQARSKEWGLQYTQTQWQWRITAFDNRYTDLIDNDENWDRTNVSRARNQGAEMAMSGNWEGRQWRMSMTSQDPINEVTDKPLMRRAKMIAQAGITQNWGAWQTAAQVRYSGSRTDGSEVLNAYAVLDFIASTSLTNELKLTARLENIANEKYQTIYGYNTPGRGFFMGLKWAPVL